MSKKSEARRLEAVDPTLPTTTITLDGKEYRLCFDLGALAEAEREINKQGYDLTIMLDLADPFKIHNARNLFAASVRRFQPELEFEEARNLVKFNNMLLVGNAVAIALGAAVGKSEANPTEANPVD